MKLRGLVVDIEGEKLIKRGFTEYAIDKTFCFQIYGLIRSRGSFCVYDDLMELIYILTRINKLSMNHFVTEQSKFFKNMNF